MGEREGSFIWASGKAPGDRLGAFLRSRQRPRPKPEALSVASALSLGEPVPQLAGRHWRAHRGAHHCRPAQLPTRSTSRLILMMAVQACTCFMPDQPRFDVFTGMASSGSSARAFGDSVLAGAESAELNGSQRAEGFRPAGPF